MRRFVDPFGGRWQQLAWWFVAPFTPRGRPVEPALPLLESGRQASEVNEKHSEHFTSQKKHERRMQTLAGGKTVQTAPAKPVPLVAI
ncbi:hypothetical protein CA85_39880 [Allorhodopirellula solitaria]|uniref:Uncharacterized protein n=1 Tax=Allorhodopirellula solitaria TaxID=2527987 RepID=A0A5C5XBJ3_9BACT|nr:hypothetical protein CA85_39880 [Allorhodopirellula solitaria]